MVPRVAGPLGDMEKSLFFAIAAKKGRVRWCPNLDGKLLRVRYRSHATFSRQPRQVRKEATVTGSYVCSGFPVPGFFSLSTARLIHTRFSSWEGDFSLGSLRTLCVLSG